MKRRKGRKTVHAKRKLGLPDLEQAKSAVLASLRSPESQRSYRHSIDEFVLWYCSEPRLSFISRSARLRTARSRTDGIDLRSPPAPRRALGYCRFGWEGRSHPNRAGSGLGEAGDR